MEGLILVDEMPMGENGEGDKLGSESRQREGRLGGSISDCPSIPGRLAKLFQSHETSQTVRRVSPPRNSSALISCRT